MKIKIHRPADVSSAEIVDGYLADDRPKLSVLRRMNKMKTLIHALAVPGKKIAEARKESGVTSTRLKKVFDNPMGRMLLEQYLEKDFTPDVVRKKMKELWDAKEVTVNRFGETVVKPNYDIQDKALSRVLKMKKWADTEEVDGSKGIPSTIIFNVMKSD